MSRTKGTYSISANIETNASAPLDARSRVNTLADLTDSASFPYPYVGMETFVVSEGIKYILTDLPTTNAANWRPADAEELIKVALGEDIFEGHEIVRSSSTAQPVEIVIEDLQPDSTSDYYKTYLAPGLHHPQEISNCVINVVEGVTFELGSGSYTHEPLEVNISDQPNPVGYYTQEFTLTVDGSTIEASFTVADNVFRFWSTTYENFDTIENSITSITYLEPCVNHKTTALNFNTATWDIGNDEPVTFPYLNVQLPVVITDALELGLIVNNDDYYDISTQPPSVSDTTFWEHYTEDAWHPIFDERVNNLWIGEITLTYWDENLSETASIASCISLTDDDITLLPESPSGDHTILTDIFQHAGIKVVTQLPTTPGSIQVGDEYGTIITQSDITIGGKSILNIQPGGSSSGGGGEVDPDVAALVQQFKDADVTISKTPVVEPQDLFTTITFTNDNCSTENIPAGGEGSYIATATLYDKRIKAAGLYNFYIEFKEPWGPYEVICQIYEGNGQCIVYDDNLGVWSGYCAPRNSDTHYSTNIKIEISDGQIRFVCNNIQFNTLLDVFESIAIGYEEAEPEGLLTIGSAVIKGTTDLTVNNEPIVSDGLQKIQRDFENADLTVSKTTQAEDDVYTTTVYNQQSVTDWYTHTVSEPTDQGSTESSIYTYLIEDLEVTSTLNTLSIALQSGYTFEYYGSITDGVPSDPGLITYSPMSVGLDNYMGPMWIGYGSIHDVNTDDYFDLKYTIQANHTINFKTSSSDKALEDIIDSITLSAPGKYNVYSGKITVGNNLQITESDIVVNNRSVIEPASVMNSGRVILTRADGATIYDDAASYDADVNDVPITLTASQIKAMIDKAIEESGGGGGETIIQVLDGTMGPYTQSRNMIVNDWADNTMVLEDHTQT